MTYDPWAPPSGQRAAPRQGPPVPLIALMLVAVLAAAGVVLLVRDRRGGPTDSAVNAVRAWVKAARAGDLDALREAVAPSQRHLVADADPFGLGVLAPGPKLAFGVDAGPVAGTPRVDEALVEVRRSPPCPPKDSGCIDVLGSGPGDDVLALREGGRWHVAARPIRLVRRVTTEQVTAVVTQHLVLTGGVTFERQVEDRTPGRTCAALGLGAFVFNPIREDVRVYVSHRDENPPPGDVRSTDVRTHLTGGEDGNRSWYPHRPIVLRRAKDNESGSLDIERWEHRPGGPLDKGPLQPPVSGKLTWTCRTERAPG